MWSSVQLAIVICVAFFVQATVAPHLSRMGAKPDIVLIVAALFGFAYGPQTGGLAGFFGGLLGDLLTGSAVGIGLMSKTVVGFFAGMVQRAIFVKSIILPMLAIFVATWIHEFIYVGFLFLFGNTTSIDTLIWNIVLPSAVYNAICTPPVFILVRRFLDFRQDTPAIRVTGTIN
ncbi:MAG: rod shape-determining protein MreD [Rubrobacteridae bacterium]|nr:rod shape-determining protein MreD [Rubrobacteridae bacterium]